MLTSDIQIKVYPKGIIAFVMRDEVPKRSHDHKMGAQIFLEDFIQSKKPSFVNK